MSIFEIMYEIFIGLVIGSAGGCALALVEYLLTKNLPLRINNPPGPPLCDVALEVNRMSEENARLIEALTWRACPKTVSQSGVYLGKWGEGLHEFEAYWIEAHNSNMMPYALTHICGPLPLLKS